MLATNALEKNKDKNEEVKEKNEKHPTVVYVHRESLLIIVSPSSTSVSDDVTQPVEPERKRNPFLPSLGGGKKKGSFTRKCSSLLRALIQKDCLRNLDLVVDNRKFWSGHIRGWLKHHYPWNEKTYHGRRGIWTARYGIVKPILTSGLKLHKFKCFTEGDVPLNPRQAIEEQLQDGDCVIIKTVNSGLTQPPTALASKVTTDAPVLPEEGTLF